ncbi:MAG: hypothetical protein UH080_06635, partial [Ruminococcus sp.]|nr:hypothetical protein [Ruminococcus sp.]
DSPYFNLIKFELTKFGRRPESRFTNEYREYERQADEIKRILMPSMYGNQPFGQPNGFGAPQMPYQGQPQGGFVREGYQQPMQQGYPQQNGYQQPMQQGYPQQNGYQQPMQQGYPQQNGYQQPMQQGYPQQNGYQQPMQGMNNVNPTMGAMWVCQTCNTQNTGKFCVSCGSQPPMGNQYGGNAYGNPQVRCDKCGWVPSDPNNIPRFCPQCGDPIDFNDMR